MTHPLYLKPHYHLTSTHPLYWEIKMPYCSFQNFCLILGLIDYLDKYKSAVSSTHPLRLKHTLSTYCCTHVYFDCSFASRFFFLDDQYFYLRIAFRCYLNLKSNSWACWCWEFSLLYSEENYFSSHAALCYNDCVMICMKSALWFALVYCPCFLNR